MKLASIKGRQAQPGQVELLEAVLGLAKTGEMVAFALVGVRTDGSVFDARSNTEAHAAILLGASVVLQNRLATIINDQTYDEEF